MATASSTRPYSQAAAADTAPAVVRQRWEDLLFLHSGTLEHFLIERYVLYAWTGSRLLRGRVRHEPYPVQEAELDGLEEGLFRSAGLKRPKLRPLAHYARGVTVDIGWPKRQEP